MLIIVGGSPGSGKSTLCEAIRSVLGCPMIDFGSLREFHLERDWSNQNEKEERIAFENLVFIVRNYFRHGYEHVLVNDFKEPKVLELLEIFEEGSRLLVTVTADDATIRQRVGARLSGFTNVEAAAAWNQRLRNSKPVPGELRIDTSEHVPDVAASMVLSELQKYN